MSSAPQMSRHSRSREADRARRMARHRRRPRAEALERYELLAATIFTVSNTTDVGAGSLRQAMNLANSTAGPAEIDFNIPTSDPGFNAANGTFKISVGTATSGTRLPTSHGQVFINGASEAAFLNPTIPATTPRIVVDGTSAPFTNAFDLGPPSTTHPEGSSGSKIQGLDIVNFSFDPTTNNGGTAITIENTSTGDVVSGNYLGVGPDGTTPAPNANAGVFVASSNNTIGGFSGADRNIISGNGKAGIAVTSIPAVPIVFPNGSVSANNLIANNFIGTDVTGTKAVPNGAGFGGFGVGIAAQSTTILGNVISANGGDGIILTSKASDLNIPIPGIPASIPPSLIPPVVATLNVIQGNKIGTDLTGEAALGNGGFGVDNRDAQNTLIGGAVTTPGRSPGNLISGNGNFRFSSGGSDGGGVDIFASDTTPSAVSVLGNLIGTDLAGTKAIPNTEGVVVEGSAGNVIGGTAGLGNVISGNGSTTNFNVAGNGVAIVGTNATGNVVLGNFLGADVSGNAPLGNTGRGAFLGDASQANVTTTGVASGNTVGGSAAGQGNVIVANGFVQNNTTSGVKIQGSLQTVSTGNVVQGNQVGVFANGTTTAASPNGFDGIHIQSGSGNLVVGNTITNSQNWGVEINGQGSQSNILQRNLIANSVLDGILVEFDALGKTAILGNVIQGSGGNGVLIGAPGNIIGGAAAGAANTIIFNKKAGVGFESNEESSADVGNLISRNVIAGNAALGISLTGTATPLPINSTNPGGGPNNLQTYPLLSTSSIDGNGVTHIQGTLTGTVGASYTLEFFSNVAADPSGHGQGQTFLASQSVTIPQGGVANFDAPIGTPTAAFISATATDSANNTSEFSANLVVQVPLVTPTTTTLTDVGPNPSTFGQQVTFTALVSSQPVPTFDTASPAVALRVPTGQVEFLEGTTVLGMAAVDSTTGVATFPISTLAVGSHTVTAVFLGGPGFQQSPASNPVTQVVNAPALPTTTTTLTSAPNPSTFGQQATFTAVVQATGTTAIPGGQVNFLEGTTLLGSGTLDGTGHATFPISTLAVGPHVVTAVYLGNSGFQASPLSNVVTQVVNPVAGLLGTTTTLSSAPDPSTFGQVKTFTVVVSPTTPVVTTGPILLAAVVVPTGSVTLFEGTTPIGSGTLDGTGMAQIPISTLSVGPHVVTAVYSGDPIYQTSSSLPDTQTVTPAPSNTALQPSTTSSTEGQPITFTATITAAQGTGTPTGSVTFLDGSTPLGQPVALDRTGAASITVSSLSPGTHTIVAQYGGDATHSGSSMTVGNIVVSPSGVDGPTVTNLQRFGFHAQPTFLVLSFSAPLDPATAQIPANYTIVGPVGPRGRTGHLVTVTSAVLDPSSNTVTLSLRERLDVHKRYRLTVNGTSPFAVTSSDGVPIDGANTGQPGSDFVRTFGREILAGPASALPSPSTPVGSSSHARTHVSARAHVSAGAVDHLLSAGALHAKALIKKH